MTYFASVDHQMNCLHFKPTYINRQAHWTKNYAMADFFLISEDRFFFDKLAIVPLFNTKSIGFS